MGSPTFTLDRFDRAILAILENDNQTPQRSIGEQVGLSAPAVQRRIKHLLEAKVIEANIACINPAAIGKAITVIVEVELSDESGTRIDEIKASFLSTPQVQQCYYVTGEVDFVLIILVEDMGAYEALTRQIFFQNSNVKKFRTLVVMDRVKTGMQVRP